MWGGMETESAAFEKRFGIVKPEGGETELIRGVSVFGSATVSGSPAQLEDTDLDGEADIYGEIKCQR
jgi:hypothetical protein